MSKITRAKQTRGVTQAVKRLLCNLKALSLDPHPTKKKQNKKLRVYIYIYIYIYISFATRSLCSPAAS
jgi:hypothetical protein